MEKIQYTDQRNDEIYITVTKDSALAKHSFVFPTAVL